LIIWLNGTFGAGKTSTAAELTKQLAGSRTFDPEWVGYMLKANLSDHDFTDFQQLEPWRTLVPVVAAEVAQYTGQHLVAVQSVLVRSYWQQLSAGLRRLGLEVFHVLLDAPAEVLTERIKADTVEAGACQWRLDHLADYAAALPWLTEAADLVVDTSAGSAAEVAAVVAAAVGPRLAAAGVPARGAGLQSHLA
jgi:adenylylsulfate kinase-like enzyme